jgi:hypothetical protein
MGQFSTLRSGDDETLALLQLVVKQPNLTPVKEE